MIDNRFIDLAERNGIVLKDELPPSGIATYDGNNLYLQHIMRTGKIGRMTSHNLTHEIGHFICAPDYAKHLPNYGMQYSILTDSNRKGVKVNCVWRRELTWIMDLYAHLFTVKKFLEIGLDNTGGVLFVIHPDIMPSKVLQEYYDDNLHYIACAGNINSTKLIQNHIGKNINDIDFDALLSGIQKIINTKCAKYQKEIAA